MRRLKTIIPGVEIKFRGKITDKNGKMHPYFKGIVFSEEGEPEVVRVDGEIQETGCIGKVYDLEVVVRPYNDNLYFRLVSYKPVQALKRAGV